MIEGLESLTHPRSRRNCVACETDILRTANYPYARLVNDCLYRTLPGNEAVKHTVYFFGIPLAVAIFITNSKFLPIYLYENKPYKKTNS